MAFRARLQGAVDRARALAVRASLRVSPTEPQRVLLLTIALGAVCGLVAVAFHVAIRTAQTLLIDRFQNVSLDATSALAVLLLPAAGGVVAGVLLEHVVPSARGSGILQVKLAYALDSRGTRLRDAVGKFFVCTLQLGSGASLGREGPTVQICAGGATTLGRFFALSPANLRRLIPVGGGGGGGGGAGAPPPAPGRG